MLDFHLRLESRQKNKLIVYSLKFFLGHSIKNVRKFLKTISLTC